MLDNTRTTDSSSRISSTPIAGHPKAAFLLVLTLNAVLCVGTGCVSRHDAIRAQRVGGVVVGTGALVGGIGAGMVLNPNGKYWLEGMQTTAIGATIALAGATTLLVGSVERESFRRHPDRWERQMWVSPREPMLRQSLISPPASEAELNQLLDDICAIVPGACLPVRSCVLCDDAVACEAVDSLVADGVLSASVWSYLQRQ